jgi:hypothetical protein
MTVRIEAVRVLRTSRREKVRSAMKKPYSSIDQDSPRPMRRIRLEWTRLPKDRLSANVTCFIRGKNRLLSIVTLDRNDNYKLAIGDGLITGNLKRAKQSGRMPMKIKWSSDGSGRFRHRLNAPIDVTQLRLGSASAFQVVQECVAAKAGVCPCGSIEWVS